jgi:hypothetical protein
MQHENLQVNVDCSVGTSKVLPLHHDKSKEISACLVPSPIQDDLSSTRQAAFRSRPRERSIGVCIDKRQERSIKSLQGFDSREFLGEHHSYGGCLSMLRWLEQVREFEPFF